MAQLRVHCDRHSRRRQRAVARSKARREEVPVDDGSLSAQPLTRFSYPSLDPIRLPPPTPGWRLPTTTTTTTTIAPQRRSLAVATDDLILVACRRSGRYAPIRSCARQSALRTWRRTAPPRLSRRLRRRRGTGQGPPSSRLPTASESGTCTISPALQRDPSDRTRRRARRRCDPRCRRRRAHGRRPSACAPACTCPRIVTRVSYPVRSSISARDRARDAAEPHVPRTGRPRPDTSAIVPSFGTAPRRRRRSTRSDRWLCRWRISAHSCSMSNGSSGMRIAHAPAAIPE